MKNIDSQIFRTQLVDNLAAAQRTQLSIEGFQRAGVLVPILLGSGPPELLFTKRTDSVDTHKGQISFPGGMADEADRDIVSTSLRETHEELGIPESSVHVAGLLDDHATPTRFIITPVVGIIENLPELSLNMDEVAEVFRVPLEFFVNPSNGRVQQREFRGTLLDVWFYEYGSHTIWGATAMIVRSLLKRLAMV